MIPQRVAGSSTLAMLEKVRQMKAQGLDVISFAAGESDFPTPPVIIEEAHKEMLAGNTRYVSTNGVPALREALAKDYKGRLGVSWIKPANFLAVAGAKQGIHLVLSCLCQPGDEVMVPAPYWVSYPGIVKSILAEVKVVPTLESDRYFPTPESLENAYTPKCKALIFASPNNPTGMMIEEAKLQAVIEWCIKKKVLLLYDELYERLVFGKTKHASALAMINEEQSEWVVSINAFSKTFGMTGWRIGWVASHPSNIERLSDLQSQVLTCLPGFAQVAAARGMADMETILGPIIAAFGRRKNIVMEMLTGVPGLKLLEPEGAFYFLVDVSGVIAAKKLKDDKDFVAKLLDAEGVVGVAGSAFGAPGSFRISFAMNEEDLRKGLERFRRFCNP